MALWFQKRRLQTDNAVITHLGILFFFVFFCVYFLSTKNGKLSREPSNERSYQVLFQLGPCFQRGRLKRDYNIFVIFGPLVSFVYCWSAKFLFRGPFDEHYCKIWFLAQWVQKWRLKTDNNLFDAFRILVSCVLPINNKNKLLVHQSINITSKFGSKWSSGFRWQD